MKEKQKQEKVRSDCRDVRAMPLKMFATDASENDPVVVYKLYAKKRPEKTSEDDFPFYL